MKHSADFPDAALPAFLHVAVARTKVRRGEGSQAIQCRGQALRVDWLEQVIEGVDIEGAQSEVSRPTVTNWLEIYQITHVAHVLRPFSAGGRREVIAQPKVFGFDTGLVCHARGWDSLRAEDCGTLWEHLVLDTLIAAGVPKIHYWRDKQQREVDFVVLTGRDDVDAIECKWSPEAFEARGLKAFREYYTSGKNYVVCPLSGPGYERVYEGLTVTVVSPGELRQRMTLLFFCYPGS